MLRDLCGNIYYALTSELWLLVITLSMKVVLEMQVILWLEWNLHKFAQSLLYQLWDMCEISETCKYHTIIML